MIIEAYSLLPLVNFGCVLRRWECSLVALWTKEERVIENREKLMKGNGV